MQKITYCRNCAGNCGLLLEVENERIVSVQTDRQNAVSEGYACIKGRMAADLHNGDEPRLTHCLKRGEDGRYHPIDKYQAVDEIAERLRGILDRHGPRALAAFFGTTSYSDCVGKPFLKSLMSEIGSPAIFSSMTVDQASKWVTAGRMGTWANGKPVSDDTDVILVAGSNPPVSHQGYPMLPVPCTNTAGHIRAARKRGAKFIVIDPRKTEFARYADLFIQPKPGHDAEIFAALLNIVLSNGWEDQAFAARWTVNLDRLREAVAPFTAQRVAESAGIEAAQLEQAASLLAQAKKPGLGTGTGHNMAAFSNTAEHLVEALTGLVGGYIRAGDRIPNPGVFIPRPDEEMVIPPNRSWESEPHCASDPSYGKLMGEFPASIFPDEVLDGGDNAIRAMFVTGSNPAMCLSEPERTHEALRALDLLVTFDPREDSATAQLSDYIIAPTLQFERAEVTTFTEVVFHFPFIQYSPASVAPPPQTLGEQEFFWLLAKKLGIQLTLKNAPWGMEFDDYPIGLPIDMETMPSRESLIEWMVSQTAVSFETLKAHPHGYTVPMPEKRLRAPELDSGARLDLCPADVFDEIAAVEAAMSAAPEKPFLLSSRRIIESFNSSFHGHDITLGRHGTNRLYAHPDDLQGIGVTDGDAVRVRSEFGELIGYVRQDAGMRRGVVSMTHCWGAGAKADPWALRGAHTGRLISMHHYLQSGNRMPRQSGVPVDIEPLGFNLEQAQAGTAPQPAAA